MRIRLAITTAALGFLAVGCGGTSQEEVFRQDGVDAASKNIDWSAEQCNTSAGAVVSAQASAHQSWTSSQRKSYEAAYVDGCLSALKPVQGTYQ